MRPWQHGIHVRHQFHVVVVIVANLFKTVREQLPQSKVLLEVREARSQRMTPRVDNARVRQHQMDERYMAEVVRHLVDEERAPQFAVNACGGQKALAHGKELFGRYFGQQVNVVANVHVGLPFGQLARQPCHVRQLHRSFHQRMAGENLFDERGAGARQANDEDGVRGWAAHALARGKQFAGEELFAAAHMERYVHGGVA